ncbi:hypothetical protein EDC96DRAFT_434555 [Choanephora cucurbitarum]|nr:hypothetical protein EDC96DRAFT_434555 [Choanephora cucurbitarum]
MRNHIKNPYLEQLPIQQNKPQPNTAHLTKSWENTIERCIKSIVSISGCRTRGIDTEIPGSYTATGFVVDPERGLILSNRHVVSVSPIKAYAVLCNYEEIELEAIYRDPVHDFGFFKYDPTKVRFLDIPGIELYPQGAKVGQEIRVVGNDAGEKLSILSGTLARLDREAPNYGIGQYNDFNTFYFQAASSTSSGSSGSPVLDKYGRAVALNAGGASTSSSSYYLPLDRTKRALELLQDDRSVIPRGTLQTTFQYQSYDALLQLGLSRHMEKRLRSQQSSEGLLVVKSVLPDGPAYGHLEPGDILLTCNGQLLPKLFVDLEEHLDNAIENGTTVHLTISRADEIKEFNLTVQDLHKITPYRFLEFGGGVLNDLSYQIARSYGLSLQNAGVYVGMAGFILSTARAMRGSVIVGINNQQVRSLDEFVSVVSTIEQGKRVPIRYYSLQRAMKVKVMIAHVDWRWNKFQLATRNDKTGIWDYQVLKTPLDNMPKEIKDITNEKTSLKESKATSPQELCKSIVSVDCLPPFMIDGSKNAHSYGAGIVVSMNPPLILCDRDTVPISIGVISVTFDNSMTVSADLVFLHPFYNFAVLKFDPSPVIQAGIDIKVAQLVDKEFEVGDQVTYVGMSGRNEVQVKNTTINDLTAIRTSETKPARWRAINIETFKVTDGNLSSQGGLFADEQGQVRAIWMNFSVENDQGELSSIFGGVSTSLILPILRQIQAGTSPVVKGLDVEFWSLQICNARLIGVTDEWVEKIKQKAKNESRPPSVLYALGITDVSSPSGQLLQSGDILLAINHQVVSSISDLCRFHDQDTLVLTILRDGVEKTMEVKTTVHTGQETTAIAGWQGLIVQNTYAAAREQVRTKVPEGVYVASFMLGSPAQGYLKPGIWITEVDQTPVRTLDEFLEAVKPEVIQKKKQDKRRLTKEAHQRMESVIQHQTKQASSLLALPTKEEREESEAFDHDGVTHVQIKCVNADNLTQVKALKLDTHYWPTWHLTKAEHSPLGFHMSFL